MENKNLALLFLFIISIFLIGIGVNGFVVSQSCCFPPFCAAENICDAANFNAGFDTGRISIYTGAALFLSTIITYIIINRK